MSELFDSWSWQRKQPAPFDQYDESELKRTDTISMYNAGPRKVATIHPVAIRAILAYMNLETGTLPPGQKHLGAIGILPLLNIQAYPGKSMSLHITGTAARSKPAGMRTLFPLPKNQQAIIIRKMAKAGQPCFLRFSLWQWQTRSLTHRIRT